MIALRVYRELFSKAHIYECVRLGVTWVRLTKIVSLSVCVCVMFVSGHVCVRVRFQLCLCSNTAGKQADNMSPAGTISFTKVKIGRASCRERV